MAGILNKAGFESNRNFAKPFKHQRMVPNGEGGVKVHWQDNMRLGPQGQSVNSTGCFGIPNRFSTRVKMFGPKKGKVRNFKRKGVARVCSSREEKEIVPKMLAKMLEIRGELLTLKTIGEWSNRDFMGQHFKTALVKISRNIFMDLPENQRAKIMTADDQREASLLGRLEKEGLGVVHLRKVRAKVEFALAHMNRW